MNRMKKCLLLLMTAVLLLAPGGGILAEGAGLTAAGEKTLTTAQETALPAAGSALPGETDPAASPAEEKNQPAANEKDARVTAWLAEQAVAQKKDPWTAAILSDGAKDITWEGNKAVFYLRGYNPDLKSLGAYAKAADKEAWRKKALENISAWSLRAELTFETDGKPGKKSAAALIQQIKKAASAARGAMDKKDMTDALTDLLFPAPIHVKQPTAAALMMPEADFGKYIAARPELFSAAGTEEWAYLFYVQRAWKINVRQGPHTLKMTWDGADPLRLLDQAYDALTSSLAAVPGAQRAKEESLPKLWQEALAEAAVKAKKGRLISQSAVFDVDDLIAGVMPEGYTQYIERYTPGEWYDRLVSGYRAMPQSASQPLPKTGIITKVKKGRGVMVKVDKNGRNTYVQLRDADTGVIVTDAFIAPGKNLTLKVPEGVYVVQYATGATWYGLEETFGPMGEYLASNEFIVAKNKWNLKAGKDQEGITLHPITAADMAPAEDRSVHIVGTLKPEAGLLQAEYPENNPVIPGVSSTTGLPSSGEAYTPVVMVLDNAEEAYPHWGVSEADIIFQVPNAGSGATKLLALFADHYPEQAGPVRSGRSSMLPAALSFDAAFAFAGPPAVAGGEVDILEVMNRYQMNRTHRIYNLLNSNGYGERWKAAGSHNLSCHIADIHANLINNEVEFDERPFLFTDEPREKGAAANIIRVLHRGDDPKSGSNSASRGVFKYNAETGTYTRTNSSGDYSDRLTGETVTFANVLVLRTNFSYDRNYIYLKDHLKGEGTLEIFQNGKYVRGAWKRQDVTSRLILVDADGSELQLQRGKTFIVMTNDVTDVIYSE